jgi:IS5 family transposase
VGQDKLAFHLEDSLSYRRFCRFGIAETPPKRSTLQQNIKRVKASTWEAINRLLVKEAERIGVEDGQTVRVDSTVVESHIHHPNDSSLLYDVVCELVRLMKRSRVLVSTTWTNHRRVAKCRSFAIANAKSMKARVPLYRELMDATQRTLGYARQVRRALLRGRCERRRRLADRIESALLLGENVLDQARRRVLDGESVPATDKVVSIYEPHTDVIVKGGREVQYGHKVFLTVGKSGLVLDLVVEAGNPIDSSRVVPMLQRHRDLYGRVPEQASFDAGFSTKDNLAQVRALGVRDASFARRSGVDVLSVVRSTWVYKRLQRFRAGIEGIISFLKRSFGFDRCTWRSERSFHAYAHAAVLSANLLMLARHLLR